MPAARPAKPAKKPTKNFSVGIEEEYLLISAESAELIGKAPRGLMPAMRRRLGSLVSPEFFQAQVEIQTPPANSIGEARQHLANMRRQTAEVAGRFGLQIIAASTHPSARRESQRITQKRRYTALADDLQAVGRRFMVCGMHVHVGVEGDDLRVDLMSQSAYILPHLLALSVSSPFWHGYNTGLRSYRMSVWDEMPRTGLPYSFSSFAEYRRHVDVLARAGVIEDASKIWWDLRPSLRHPTLEMRIADICTSLDDSICIAALYMCWLRMLCRLRANNQRWRAYSNMLIAENRWRAHRYGTDRGLIDLGRGKIMPYRELLADILALIEQDAKEANCWDEARHAKTILRRGASAHRQIAVYEAALKKGESHEAALQKTTRWLAKETLNF